MYVWKLTQALVFMLNDAVHDLLQKYSKSVRFTYLITDVLPATG